MGEGRYANPIVQQRLREIVRFIARRGKVTLAEIAGEVDISTSTARDYMRQLRKEGKAHRIVSHWYPGPDAAWYDSQREGDGPIVTRQACQQTGAVRRDPLVAAMFGQPKPHDSGEQVL